MSVVATPDQALADIVNQDLRTAPIFESFGLDYCCGGHQTLAEACAKRSVDPAIVLDAQGFCHAWGVAAVPDRAGP